jgi:hypothetical protein
MWGLISTLRGSRSCETVLGETRLRKKCSQSQEGSSKTRVIGLLCNELFQLDQNGYEFGSDVMQLTGILRSLSRFPAEVEHALYRFRNMSLCSEQIGKRVKPLINLIPYYTKRHWISSQTERYGGRLLWVQVKFDPQVWSPAQIKTIAT